jgi:cell wall-associated NlpC family hydrolase
MQTPFAAGDRIRYPMSAIWQEYREALRLTWRGYHRRSMTETRPRSLDNRRAQQLLSKAKVLRSVADRVDVISRLLLGCSYAANPLGGSPHTPEVFTASLAGFDCVTYVETVLALSLASTPGEFTDWLRQIRYEGGRVEWARRNHYMTGWIRSNARIGVVRPISAGPGVANKDRLLDIVPGLPPARTRFSCVPKREIRKLERRLLTGDLIFFASTRAHLDIFHCGILVRDVDHWRMRHAARSRKRVVEQDLSEFLGANRMAGILVVRPSRDTGTTGEERP